MTLPCSNYVSWVLFSITKLCRMKGDSKESLRDVLYALGDPRRILRNSCHRHCQVPFFALCSGVILNWNSKVRDKNALRIWNGTEMKNFVNKRFYLEHYPKLTLTRDSLCSVQRIKKTMRIEREQRKDIVFSLHYSALSFFSYFLHTLTFVSMIAKTKCFLVSSISL
jgi:hypothetical protein